MSSNREELIEKAKIAMATAEMQRPEHMDSHTLEVLYGAAARAAWEVFEAAQAPGGGELFDELLPKFRKLFDRLIDGRLILLSPGELEAAIGKALLEFHGPPARTVTYKNGPGKKYALSDLVQETAKQVAEENSELLSRLEEGPGKKYEPVGVFTRSGTVERVHAEHPSEKGGQK